MADQLTAIQLAEAQCVLLFEIKGLLTEIRAAVTPDECDECEGCENEDAPCLHPTESRISLNGFGEKAPNFICRLCGHQEQPTIES